MKMKKSHFFAVLLLASIFFFTGCRSFGFFRGPHQDQRRERPGQNPNQNKGSTQNHRN